MEKIFTPAESKALVLIADALEGDRLHEDVTDFSARTLSIAAGIHPHLCDYLLDWLGVFRLHGYRRSVEQLRAAVDAHLESAQRRTLTPWARSRSAIPPSCPENGRRAVQGLCRKCTGTIVPS